MEDDNGGHQMENDRYFCALEEKPQWWALDGERQLNDNGRCSTVVNSRNRLFTHPAQRGLAEEVHWRKRQLEL